MNIYLFIMQTVRITTSQNIDIEYEAASVGDRILGYLIDTAIFIGIYIVLLVIALMGMDGFGNVGLVVPGVIGIFVLLYALYDLICEVLMNGQSIGKKAMKIRVISLDGGRPTIGQYLIRWLLRIVDFSLTSGLGALIAVIVTPKKQRIGDIAAGTTVIKTNPRTPISHLVFTPPPADYRPVFSQVAALSEQDIILIHEVISNYAKSGNVSLLYNMAIKVKSHLAITSPSGMDDLTFLQTILKDYNHSASRGDGYEAK